MFENEFKSVCQKFGLDPNAVNVSVSIVSPSEIRALKKKYFGLDVPTDVLSFPNLDLKRGQIPTRALFPLDFNPETNKIELGDIVINEQEPDKSALFIHGLKHLLGEHHE